MATLERYWQRVRRIVAQDPLSKDEPAHRLIERLLTWINSARDRITELEKATATQEEQHKALVQLRTAVAEHRASVARPALATAAKTLAETQTRLDHALEEARGQATRIVEVDALLREALRENGPDAEWRERVLGYLRDVPKVEVQS